MTAPSNDQPPTPKPSRRGGRRPGAGAKPGNLNALKHGRRSAQFAEIGALLATIPETRQALLQLAARHRLKQRKAEHVAALLLGSMIERARSIAERQTINEDRNEISLRQVRRARQNSTDIPQRSNRQRKRHRTIEDQERNPP